MKITDIVNESTFDDILATIKKESPEGRMNISKGVRTYCKNIDIGDLKVESIRKSFNALLKEKEVLGDTVYRSERNELKYKKKHKAKILVFDIETSYITGAFFSLFQKGVPHSNVLEDWYMFCFSYKWLFEDEVYNFKLTKEELETGDDRRLVKELWKLLNEADIVVGHNSDKFDLRKTNAKFFTHGLSLPSPYQSIDTFKSVRKTMSFTSLSLDFLAKVSGFDGKKQTSAGLWLKIYRDKEYESLEEMAEYNNKDVIELENIYLDLHPYLTQQPNIGLFVTSDELTCSQCGSDDLSSENMTPYRTSVNEFTTYRCGECGSISRDRKAIKHNKNNLTVSIAR